MSGSRKLFRNKFHVVGPATAKVRRPYISSWNPTYPSDHTQYPNQMGRAIWLKCFHPRQCVLVPCMQNCQCQHWCGSLLSGRSTAVSNNLAHPSRAPRELTQQLSKVHELLKWSSNPSMYVCKYVCNNIYVRAAAYSLDCHGGTVVNHKLYRTFQSSIEHRTWIWICCRLIHLKDR